MYEASRSPLEVPTPHHLLDGFLAARAETMPEVVHARDREVIEWFRAFMVSRDESEGRVSPPDELARRRTDRHGPAPHDLLGAQRITIEIRRVLAVGSPLTTAPPQDAAARLVLRLLCRWMLHRQLVNESESRLIDSTAKRYAPSPPARRRPPRPPGTARRRW